MKERNTSYDAILPWYRAHKRELPWRADREPYHVWLSEIMLQQTRVEAVKGYYTRFLAALPTVEALANADEELLLKLWEGLGYYRRVRNLQKGARSVMTDFGGVFPRNYEEIRGLCGIGEYTAGAIASICFDAKTPAVDGNVLRVLSRILDDDRPTDDERVKREYRARLAEAYPEDAGDFTQAWMELGATVCVPNGTPLCEACPLAELCLARKHGTVALRPVRKEKKQRKTVRMTVFLLHYENKLAIAKREAEGLLGGLYEFPHWDAPLTAAEAAEMASTWAGAPCVADAPYECKHIFTHITWEMTCIPLRLTAPPQEGTGLLWVTEAELSEHYPLPTAFAKCKRAAEVTGVSDGRRVSDGDLF